MNFKTISLEDFQSLMSSDTDAPLVPEVLETKERPPKPVYTADGGVNPQNYESYIVTESTGTVSVKYPSGNVCHLTGKDASFFLKLVGDKRHKNF